VIRPAEKLLIGNDLRLGLFDVVRCRDGVWKVSGVVSNGERGKAGPRSRFVMLAFQVVV
jgi:hypothetical protein